MKLIAISGWKKSGKDMLASHLIESFGAVRVAFADPLKDRVAEEYGIPRADLDDQAKKEAPLFHLPVDPQDAFARNIVEFMIGEFRNAKGLRPTGFYYSDSGLLGTFKGTGFDGEPAAGTLYDRLYWTPRALCIFKGSGNRAIASDFWVKQAIKAIRDHAYNETIWAKNAGERDVNPIIVMSDVRFKSEVAQLREAFGKELITVRVNRFDTSDSVDPSERDLDDAQFDYVIENRGTVAEALAKIEQVANLRW